MPSFFLSVSHLWGLLYLGVSMEFYLYIFLLLPYVYIITRNPEKTLKSNLKKTLNHHFFLNSTLPDEVSISNLHFPLPQVYVSSLCVQEKSV